MSVTAATGFRAAGVTAGLKSSGRPDVALVVNDGPSYIAAGVFTTNKVAAAPVLWSRQVLKWQAMKAVVLNSGGANACTGPAGFADTHHTAEFVAKELGLAPIDIAVCSTGLIGVRLDMPKLTAGISAAVRQLSPELGAAAAEAILTTDSRSKQAVATHGSVTVGGMAKGAGMIAPGMATMLAVITTDAAVPADVAQRVLQQAVDHSFNLLDSDGCMSTNDTVLLMANGASGVTLTEPDLTALVTEVCVDLARQMMSDAEGSSKDITIKVTSAASEAEAVDAARCVARSNLFKCAMFGQDPNWGRIASAVGTSRALFDADQLAISINGVLVCHAGHAHGDPTQVDLSNREVLIEIDLGAGVESGHIWTNDLTHEYVHENSAYST